ncbi:MAG: PDZ domain-containing protein, partial [Clostridiales bacterium]|nr:PDZ domain-containing protein [Clostridiales bacterium]
MRKLKFYITAAVLLLCLFFCYGSPVPIQASAAECSYYVGGMTVGFSLSAGGAEIIALNDVAAEDGLHSPAEDAGIRAGDCILAVDGIRIKNINELNAALERSGGKTVTLVIKRNGETAEVSITPVKEKKSGKFKIGVLIRDTLSGIGTVTYINKETMRFGALGHDVNSDGMNTLEIADSKVYLCSIIGVNKGVRGKAGELRGLFINDKSVAQADAVRETGLYGNFESDYDFSHTESVLAAPIGEASIGKAYIYSTINGVCPQKYEINIAKVDANNREHKNFVIKVTDERLLE